MSRAVWRCLVLALALTSACSIEAAGLGAVDASTDGDVGDGSADTNRIPRDAMPIVVRDGGVDAGEPPALDAGPACAPAPEICNALDDDCNGAVDETGCPCDVGEHAEHVYLACTSESRTWADAQSFCEELGYDLAVIDDAMENEAVRARIGDDTWIGLEDRTTEGDYVWVTGTRPGYLNWRPGDAPRGASQPTYDCVEMDAATGEWLDVACGGGRPFVCEATPDR